MPEIVKFQLRNFKGAQAVEIDVGTRQRSHVVTLIGLNESGKTTILEGLSHFATSDKTVSSLFTGPHAQRHITSIIPINRKAAFTGSIEVIAEVVLDEDDISKIVAIGARMGKDVETGSIEQPFIIKRAYKFTDSEYTPDKFGSFWGLSLNVRSRKKGKAPYKPYVRPKEIEDDLWLAIADDIEERLPKIVYFPTFIVSMPSKIYLDEHEKETPVNRYYRNLFQDILDTLDEGLSLDRHVVQRIKAYKSESNAEAWLSKLLGDPKRTTVDSVFQKLSAAVTKEVLGSWSKVFNRPVAAKRIEISWNVDAGNDDLPYASFSVSDGESVYALDERSLGLRWFFSFLLFTRFRGSQKRPNIYLFDEPAANLHARAQTELLGSFNKIIENGNVVIYLTHSHHMINPRWLSGAHIVENEAINYESADFGTDFSIKPTRVKATPYRHFVSQHPTRISYFQPVVEKLQYTEPAVVSAGNGVMVEGISDFHLFSYVSGLMGAGRPDLSFIPGVGAGTLDSVIAISLSRGSRFLILLDDDHAGRKERERYKDRWLLGADEVMTFGDLDANLRGKKLESILSAVTLEKIKQKWGGKAGKKQIALYLAEANADGQPGWLSAETNDRVATLIRAAATKLGL